MFVYRHRRKSDLQPFYIGISKFKKRAYEASIGRRSTYWLNTANKHGVEVEIIAKDLSFEEAKELEIFLIQEYGRLNIGTGCLVNLTDGGEGLLNVKHTKDSIEKMSIKASARRYSTEAKDAFKVAALNRFKDPKERQKMSEAAKTKTISQEAKAKHLKSISKRVLDLSTNITYNSAKEVAVKFNLVYTTFKNNLNGHSRNKTTFIYI